MNQVKLMLLNWQTSLFGILSFGAVLFDQVKTLFDDSAETNPDWNLVAAAFAIMLGLLRARQIGVTSVQERDATKK